MLAFVLFAGRQFALFADRLIVLFAARLLSCSPTACGEGSRLFSVEGVLHEINVEIEGLKSVADAMRAELESSFRTQVKPVHDAMQPGARVGAQIAGAEWANLQTVYAANIQGTLDALFNLDKGTQAVASAAEAIAKSYGDADAFSRAQVDDVQRVIAYSPPLSQQLGPYASEVRE